MAAAAGVERESAGGQALRHRFGLRGEKLAHPVVEAEIKNRSRTRGAGERRLVDHDDFVDAMRAGDGFARARFLVGGLSLGQEQMAVEHIVNQGRLARARDAGHAGKHA